MAERHEHPSKANAPSTALTRAHRRHGHHHVSRPSLAVFPFEPLQAALERSLPEITTDRGGITQPIHAGDVVRASDLLGVHRRILQRWAHGDRLTLAQADRCATALGLHGTRIWDDWDQLCDQIDTALAARSPRTRRAHHELEVA